MLYSNNIYIYISVTSTFHKVYDVAINLPFSDALCTADLIPEVVAVETGPSISVARQPSLGCRTRELGPDSSG